MKAFKKFFSLFPTAEVKAEIQLIPDSDHPLREDFYSWYKHNDYLFCYNMIQHGYPAPDDVKKEITTHIHNMITYDHHFILEINKILDPVPDDLKFVFHKKWYHLISNELQKEWAIQIRDIVQTEPKMFLDYFTLESIKLSKNISNFIEKKTSVYYGNAHSLKDKNKRAVLYLSQPIARKYVQDFENLIYNFNLFFLDNLSSFTLSDTLKYKDHLKQLKSTIEKKYNSLKIEESITVNLSELGLHTLSSILDSKSDFDKKIQQHFSYLKEHSISQIKKINIDSQLQKKIKNIEQKYTTTNLPLSIQNILKEIHISYLNLTSSDKIDKQLKHQLENLYNDRIPNIIVKYLNIDPEYRETLVNVEGKKPLKLLEDSLIDIKSVLENHEQENNQNKITELSIESRLIKTLKRTI